MPELVVTYVYRRGQHGIFSEVYFPRRVAAQGTIFTALQEGHEENIVKEYLKTHAEELLEEIKEYQQMFNPHQYDEKRRKRQAPISVDEARERIAIYKSPFFGWSNYVVDGVFFGEGNKMIEEATQVVRLMFCFASSYASQVAEAGCQDVLRAIIFRSITRQVLINQKTLWDKTEQSRFIKEYEPWTKEKLAFVKQYFAPVAQEVAKWMDDCWLFMFGYLVRQFSERLLSVGYPGRKNLGCQPLQSDREYNATSEKLKDSVSLGFLAKVFLFLL